MVSILLAAVGSTLAWGLFNYYQYGVPPPSLSKILPLVPFAFISMRVFKIFQLKRKYKLEFLDRSSIKYEPHYQQPDLLDKAWNMETGKLYNREMFYQPREGYCGLATLNNLFYSLQMGQLPYARMGKPFSLISLKSYLESYLNSHDHPSTVTILYGCEDQKIKALFRENINNPRFRFLANFLRGPLFYDNISSSGIFHHLFHYFRMWFIGGHWSPVISYLPEEDLLLVADVNRKYAPFLVKVDRFLDSIKTIDYTSESWRGIIVVELKEEPLK